MRGEEIEAFLFKLFVAGLAGLCQRSIGIEFGYPATFEFGQPFGLLAPSLFCFFGFARPSFGDVAQGKDTGCFLAVPDSLPMCCEPSAAPRGVSGLCRGAKGLCGLLCLQPGTFLLFRKFSSDPFGGDLVGATARQGIRHRPGQRSESDHEISFIEAEREACETSAMKWLHRIILWLDRPHHRDWRPVSALNSFRRWNGTGWEYRPMTERERDDDMRDRAW